MSGNSDELAAVRKELQAVKTKAVSKIKALQSQVDNLQAQLAERPPVGPPDEASSDGSDASRASGGFVKVDSPGGALSAAQLKAREDELGRREAELAEREAAMQRQAELTAAVNSSEGKQQAAWLPALLAGLREVQANVAQVDLACESAGVARG